MPWDPIFFCDATDPIFLPIVCAFGITPLDLLDPDSITFCPSYCNCAFWPGACDPLLELLR